MGLTQSQKTPYEMRIVHGFIYSLLTPTIFRIIISNTIHLAILTLPHRRTLHQSRNHLHNQQRKLLIAAAFFHNRQKLPSRFCRFLHLYAEIHPPKALQNPKPLGLGVAVLSHGLHAMQHSNPLDVHGIRLARELGWEWINVSRGVGGFEFWEERGFGGGGHCSDGRFSDESGGKGRKWKGPTETKRWVVDCVFKGANRGFFKLRGKMNWYYLDFYNVAVIFFH